MVGGDGMTANGMHDIAYLRSVPNTTLMAPADCPEIEAMLRFAVDHEGVVAMRQPKAPFRLKSLPGNDAPIQVGKSVTLREGADLALIAYGAMVEPSLEAADLLAEQGIEATVVNARFAKPIDSGMVERMAHSHSLLVTVEDHALQAGFGSAVAEALVDSGITGTRDVGRIVRLGIPDQFVAHGSRPELLRRLGLSPDTIAERCRREHIEARI